MGIPLIQNGSYPWAPSVEGLLNFWTPGQGNGIQTFGDAASRLNAVADDMGLPRLEGGTTAETRAKINALISATGIPEKADIYLDFLNQRYFNGSVTDAHATDILALGSDGYETFAPNVPPITDLGLLTTVGRTNLVSNSKFAGAVVGTSAGSGALPTGWTWAWAGVDLGWEVKNLTVLPDGSTSMHIELSATNTGTGSIFPRLRPPGVPMTNGQTYTSSATIEVISADGPAIYLMTSGPGGGGDQAITPLSHEGPAQKYAVSRTVTGATGSASGWGLGPTIPEGGTFLCELVLTYPQLEEGPFATDPIITEGSAVTRPGNRPRLAVPDGGRAFVFDMELLEPLTGVNGRRLLQWSSGDSNNGLELAMDGNGNFNLGVRRGGSYIGNSFGGAMNSGRNVFYGIASDDYVRSGVTHVGDGVLRTDLGALPSVDQLNYGRRPDTDTATTYMRSRQFAEFRNITDPEAAFAQAKALAQEWAAE